MTRICAVSDLHGALPTVPEADILVVAGDISPIDYDREIDKVIDWFDSDFVEWIRSTPTKYKVFIAGNHDFAIQKELKYFKEYVDPEDLLFLHDSEAEIEGINFYGIPWVPNLVGWAFYGDSQTLTDKYGLVPEGTDVVISHGPPYGVADRVMSAMHPHVGAAQADLMIRDINPKHFVCGHIHEGYGHYELEGTHIWNVAIMDAFYYPSNAPVVFEM